MKQEEVCLARCWTHCSPERTGSLLHVPSFPSGVALLMLPFTNPIFFLNFMLQHMGGCVVYTLGNICERHDEESAL